MKLSHLPRRLIIAVLVFGLCVTGTAMAFIHARSASAAPTPTFSVNVGGQTFVAQYAGHGYSNQSSHSVYSDFGQWNEYTVDGAGKWHFYGQLTGNEDVFFNGNGKIQGGVNMNLPGLGRLNTYPHEEVGGPNLPAPQFLHYNPSQDSFQGPPNISHETYLGTRLATQMVVPSNGSSRFETVDCEVDSANFDSARFGNQTSMVEWDPWSYSQRDRDCQLANSYLQKGDAGLTTFYNNFVRTVVAPQNANGPVVASLNRPHILPAPVILAIFSGIFFIGSVAAGAVCNFADCSPKAKKILAGIALGLGVISGILGISGSIWTALRAFGNQAPIVLPALVAEAAGATETTGALAPALATGAANMSTAIAGTTVAAVHVQG